MESSCLGQDNDLKDSTVNGKEIVFKVFYKEPDGALSEDLEIYRDGSWKSFYVPKDERGAMWHELRQEERQSSLEDYKKKAKEDWHSDEAHPFFVPTHKEDWPAYTTLCGVCSQPKSLDLDDCIEAYVVQYFGKGSPWKVSKLWEKIAAGELML